MRLSKRINELLLSLFWHFKDDLSQVSFCRSRTEISKSVAIIKEGSSSLWSVKSVKKRALLLWRFIKVKRIVLSWTFLRIKFKIKVCRWICFLQIISKIKRIFFFDCLSSGFFVNNFSKETSRLFVGLKFKWSGRLFKFLLSTHSFMFCIFYWVPPFPISPVEGCDRFGLWRGNCRFIPPEWICACWLLNRSIIISVIISSRTWLLSETILRSII